MKTGKQQEIKDGIVPLWHTGYYDGPLSGYCEYQGEKYLFAMKHDYISDALSKKVGRTYNLYRVTPEQWKEIEYWHNEFRLHVGKHCDYTKRPENGSYQRTVGQNDGSFEYMEEMYYERHDAYNLEYGNVCLLIEKPDNLIGWTTWGVLMGEPWQEWRKLKKENVLGEKEGT